mmetsp:Transcript_57073/g.101940  ORF Transcript_57073/g.101940 Transcript_57073/m.101940 type:complete len:417 (+) Transcript_57073:11654-12904(+)
MLQQVHVHEHHTLLSEVHVGLPQAAILSLHCSSELGQLRAVDVGIREAVPRNALLLPGGRGHGGLKLMAQVREQELVGPQDLHVRTVVPAGQLPNGIGLLHELERFCGKDLDVVGDGEPQGLQFADVTHDISVFFVKGDDHLALLGLHDAASHLDDDGLLGLLHRLLHLGLPHSEAFLLELVNVTNQLVRRLPELVHLGKVVQQRLGSQQALFHREPELPGPYNLPDLLGLLSAREDLVAVLLLLEALLVAIHHLQHYHHQRVPLCRQLLEGGGPLDEVLVLLEHLEQHRGGCGARQGVAQLYRDAGVLRADALLELRDGLLPAGEALRAVHQWVQGPKQFPNPVRPHLLDLALGKEEHELDVDAAQLQHLLNAESGLGERLVLVLLPVAALPLLPPVHRGELLGNPGPLLQDHEG